MSIGKSIVIVSAFGMLLLACATPETTPSADPTLGVGPSADTSYNPTSVPTPTKEMPTPESREIYIPIQCDDTVVMLGAKLHCWRADDNQVYTSVWSASGGYPSGGRGQSFDTKFESSGEKSIHLEICSVKMVCTTDDYKVFVQEEVAASQNVGETDRAHIPTKPIFTFACSGIGGTHEAAVNERVTCGLDRAVEGQGPGEVATVTWSAPGGLPSSGTLRDFETYYNEPGIKQIEIMACSSEGGCTSDIAIITILGTK